MRLSCCFTSRNPSLRYRSTAVGTTAIVAVSAPAGAVQAARWKGFWPMNTWGTLVLLVAMAIPATAAVIIVRTALRDAASQDRASILNAIAQLVRELRIRR